MNKPGDKVGPMRLPVSYHRLQLEYFGWNGETFKRSKVGGWGSKLNDGRWQDQPPRHHK